ncbi:MAG: alpha/beta hydrolase [Promethearchaeota archaeon]|jgi:acetyl esterase/lipase
MSIVDKSKIKRSEILETIEFRENFSTKVNEAFFSSVNYTLDDFLPLWEKVGILNERWLNGENVKNMLSMDEKLLLAEHLRFYMEYSADYMEKLFPMPNDAIRVSIKAKNVPCEWFYGQGAREDRVILYFHGGGHIMGSSNSHKLFTMNLAKATNMKVLSINYRLAPEEPHPAALEDCVSVYEWLLSSGTLSKNIVIAGDSAGGYYTLLTLLKMRDDGIKLPAGGICLAPSTDLALKGESIYKNCFTDVILGDLGYIWWVESNLADRDPFDPGISPLYADLKDLPPILLQVSTSEMLFDDSKRFYDRAKKAGVDITIQTWEDTIHGFHRTVNSGRILPESVEALEEIKKFTEKLI